MTSHYVIPPPGIGDVLTAGPAAYAEQLLPWAVQSARAQGRPPRHGPPRALAAMVTAACVLLAAVTGTAAAHARSRPSWDGRHPAVWTSPRQPLCPPRDAGRTGIVSDGARAWTARCTRDGQWAVTGPLRPSAWPASRTVRLGGTMVIYARLGTCARDLTAYAEPADGSYTEMSAARPGTVPAGGTVSLRVTFTSADETGPWTGIEVIGDACRGGGYVTAGSPASFTVTR